MSPSLLLIVGLYSACFRLHEEITVLSKKKDKLQKKLDKFSMYQKYLDKVLEVAEEVQFVIIESYFL